MKVRQLRKGQRVRLIFEGTVDKTEKGISGAEWVTVRADDPFGNGVTFSDQSGFKVELIEPDYEDGEPYLAADGSIYLYHDGTVLGRAWTGMGIATLYEFDHPERPLERLVPEVPSECDRVGGCLKRLDLPCKCDD